MSEQSRIEFSEIYKKSFIEGTYVDPSNCMECPTKVFSAELFYNLTKNAATAEANKRIDALEGEVIRERGRANSWVNEVRLLANKLGLEEENSNGSIQDWKHINKQISQLQANNNDLREALEDVKNPIRKFERDLEEGCKLNGAVCVSMLKDPETYKRIADESLSVTPAESLQAHDDEVIEKCAKVVDRFIKQEHEDGNSATALMLVQDYIRALKGKS